MPRLAARLLACQRQPEKSGFQPEQQSARETRSRASLLATAWRASAVRRWLCSRCPRRGYRDVVVLLVPPRERAGRRAGCRSVGSASEAHAGSRPISIVRTATPRGCESASICTRTSASACPYRVNSSLSPVLGSSRRTLTRRTPGSLSTEQVRFTPITSARPRSTPSSGNAATAAEVSCRRASRPARLYSTSFETSAGAFRRRYLDPWPFPERTSAAKALRR